MNVRRDVPAERRHQFDAMRKAVGPDVYVFEDFFDQPNQHPEDYRNCETSFAASMLSKHVDKEAKILDVGSNRLFIAGLAASWNVTSLDVRARSMRSENEVLMLGDSKAIAAPDCSFDAALSLNAIEHFGLGRYGDEFDPEADIKSFREWRRVVRPGGHIIFSTTVNSQGPAVAFNAHRVYSYAQIETLCAGLKRVEEIFFSHTRGLQPSVAALNSERGKWDLYAGIWQAPL
ncbi:MAG: DUF268 domain-containing protein [Rhodobacteraceae bacterium]|nr:DUF268 domain-containing protein [Paracoccaceae bacterium]